MSTRVLNPAAMMTEISRSSNLGVIVASGMNSGIKNSSNNNGGRVKPCEKALARVRRDLFGPVDHAAARALAERELKAQAILDSERWGFDFRLEVPKSGSRYEWEIISSQELVPEPYALRGMPYLRRNSPATRSSNRTPRLHRVDSNERTMSSPIGKLSPSTAERTPPQETRVPIIGDAESCTPDVVAPPRPPCKIGYRASSQSPTLVNTTLKKQASITG